MRKPVFSLSRALAVVLFMGLFSHSLGRTTHAVSPISVNTTDVLNDENDGSCDLYEALTAAFRQKSLDTSPMIYHECTALAGAKEVVFTGDAAGGIITMPTGPGSLQMPFIIEDVTIVGPVVLDGAGEKRILTVAAPGNLTLLNLTLQNGYTAGGGAAVLSSQGGKISVIGSSLLGHEAENDGGAILTSGDLIIMGSNFSGNSAGRDGGAVFQSSSYKEMQISLSAFNGNTAVKSGGALRTNTDEGEISDTVFNGNIVSDDNPDSNTKGGGAIYMQTAELVIERSIFNGNLSFDGPGGAVATSLSGELTVKDSSFNGNVAGDLSSAQWGGAIYNMEKLDIRGATFLNNLSLSGDGGALFNDKGGDLDVANATFSANGAPDGDGGALYNGNTQQGSNIASNATFRNVTLYANIANNDGSTFFNQSGNHAISLGNTIVDDANGPQANCNTDLTTLGNNLDSGNSCGLNGSGDLTNGDADLEFLNYNGGPLADLFTHLPGENSDAIDAGSNTICAAAPVENEDQTGAIRPKDGNANGTPICDIGAVEAEARLAGYGSTPIQPGPFNIGTTTGNTPISKNLVVFETGNATLSVANPTFGGAHAADFSLITPSFPLSIADGDPSVAVEIECAPSADGLRTATFTVNSNDPVHVSVTNDLECYRQAVPTAGLGSTPAAPGPIDFGERQTGTSGSRGLLLFETGNATLTFGNAVLGGAHPGDFSFNPFATSIVDGGANVLVSLSCTPSAVGLRTATFSLSTNDPLNPNVSWNLVCEGTPPPPPLLEGVGQSMTTPVNVMDGIYGVDVSPDGKHLYATAFLDDQVVVFDRDLISGDLTYVMAISNSGVNGPQLIAVSPDGKQVYVPNALSNSLVVFSRNPSNGFLSTDDIITTALLTGAYGVAVTPDGRFIYVTSLINHNIIGFERLPDDTLIYRPSNSIFTDVDLLQPRNLTISPDGMNLYVTADPASNADNGNILVYSIDLFDGSLTHEQTIHEGDLYGGPVIFGIIDGLGGAFDVSVSPDGADVYVVGTYDGAVVGFRRNPVTGLLAYNGGIRDSQTGVDGLNGVSGVDITPDGLNVVTTAYNDDAVAVMARDPGNGRLTQYQVISRGGLPNFVPRLNGARDIEVSPDGSTVHAAAFLDDAVVTLHTINPVPVLEMVAPASATAGDSGVTVTLAGQKFLAGAEALVDGSPRAVTYVNGTTLELSLTASDLASAGTRLIRVSNPAPGGGQSAEQLSFTVTAVNENPVPTISSLVPQGVLAGGGSDLLLTVAGESFISSSVVQWNGVNFATTFVDAGTLRVTIPAEALSAVGTAIVTVFNPAPGGGTSNPAGFDINFPWYNPAPTILTLDPASATLFGAAGEAITVRIVGLDFVEASQAQWNGLNRPTQYISETELEMTLTAADVTPAGTGDIMVENPAPGGGDSNSVPFRVFRFGYGIFLPVALR